MSRLSFDQEKELIQYFRDHPSLWNTKDKDYNNRMLRTTKLENIAKGLNLTRKDVYEKYRNLRTTFFREHKRVTQSTAQRPGDPPDQPSASGYVSKWRHYQNMLFLANVDRIKLESDGNGHHNEDSSSTDPIASLSTHGLNNGHEIELVDGSGGRGTSKLIAYTTAATTRPQLMDTSELEGVSHGALLSSLSSCNTSAGSIVNHHLNSHQNEENVILINSSDGNATAVNGGTILTHPNGAMNILNSRILSTTSIAQRPGTLSGASIATIAPNHSPLTSTHSVIYANHPASVAAPASLNRLKGDAASVNDLHRHLASPTGQIIPVPLHLSQFSGAALPPGVSINFYNPNNLPASAFTSPPVGTAVGAAGGSAGGSKSNGVAAISAPSGTCRSQLSPVAMQSTPIPAARKNSLFLLTSKEHSPVPSSSTTLTLDSSSSLEQSVSVASGAAAAAALSTYVLNNASLVNAASISAASSSSPMLHQTSSQFASNSSLSFGKVAFSGKPPTECPELRDVIKQVVVETIGELEDEEMSFCRSLAASLRTLERSQKELAKLELQQVIVQHTNPHYGKSNTGSLTAEEGRFGGSSTLLRSNSNGERNGNGDSTNTVATITKSGTIASNSEKSAPCENSTNNKLDNGQTTIGEGDPNGRHQHHSNKS